MTIQRFDVLNALSVRASRGFPRSTEDDVADELLTHEHRAVREQLDAAAHGGEVVVAGRDAYGSPQYTLTPQGELARRSRATCAVAGPPVRWAGIGTA